ncbi:MAG: nucleotidyltransferase family protein, partial [Clostridia bacterium]|nr:nucleotidyltransferase family protein [Clostridia bacterium]
MRVVGVIAEYNPLHLGHMHHLQAAKEAAQADYAVCVMSGCFVQRGEAAVLSPADRARMALMSGADAVILLPALWSLRDAEHFALGGVSLLRDLGCDAISFGAEDADLPRLTAAARLLEAPDEAFSAALHRHLDAGLPHPAAVAAAAQETVPGLGGLLSTPNNTLAVC